MKICLIASAGGHLTQLMQLESLWNNYDFFIVTEKKEITRKLKKKYKVHFIKDPNRNPVNFFKNLYESSKIFKKENPDIIISTGAGVALATILIAKFYGKKIAFIESLSRVKAPSITGRLAYYVSDLFLVQWKSLLKEYGDKAVYGGRVF